MADYFDGLAAPHMMRARWPADATQIASFVALLGAPPLGSRRLPASIGLLDEFRHAQAMLLRRRRLGRLCENFMK